jgi:hypothetical protein
MLAVVTVAKAATGVRAPAVSVGSGNSRPMRENAPGHQRPTDRDDQPAVIPIVRDECVHFQSETRGDAWINATETVVLEDAR